MRPSTIKRLLRDTVHIQRPGGVDEYGQPTAGSTVTAPARVVHNHRRSVDVNGVEFISTTQVALLELVTVADTLTVGGEARPVKAVKRAAGLHGGAELVEALL